MKNKKINRRKFLGDVGCAAMGATTLFSTLNTLSMANALASPMVPPPPNDYKAMVCILLNGGNDSFNMLVPTSSSAYTDYTNTRSNLALPQGDLLGLNYTDANGKQFGLHPSMPEVQQLFNDGKLSFLSNVGTLIEPTTLATFNSGGVNKPLGLFSHADQAQQWQTSIPNERSSKGWGGKIADIMNSVNGNPNLSMNISLEGTNVFQTGNNTIEYAIENTNNGSKGIKIYDQPGAFNASLSAAAQSILGQNYQNIFKKTYADRINTSQNTHETFSSAIAGVSPFATSFSDNKLSQDLLMIAKTIAAKDTLSMHKQTFFVQMNGWDNHDELLNNQEVMLGVVSKAMSEFQAALGELNLENDVTTFTISDFGRTLTSNGNGTDHAWGGNVMVMGGAVNGTQIFGEYPDIVLNSSLDVGGGVFIPQLSTDEYFAELALWFGVSPSSLVDLLPNIGNFYNTSSSNLPIGFLTV